MPTKEETDPTGYKNLVDLLAVYAEATARLGVMEGEINDELLKLVDDRRDEYAKLQETIASAEENIETLALMNPQWFAKAKTVKTPYGSVAFRKSTKLVVKNEEVTIVLIEQRGQEDKDKFLRTTQELNLEALEGLDDAELKTLRITRETSESCTVKAGKIDLGKAVAKAAKEKAAS